MQTNVIPLIDAYRTCELLTVGRDGTPIAWPTVSVRRPDGTILISTSIGFPQKAINVRRDPRVAVLFSDPTGSRLTAPDQVLVQGRATCPDEIVTDPGPWADLWLRVRERQPSSGYHRIPGMRGLMDWYYMRLLITVTPERITTSPAWRPQPPVSLPAVPAGDTGPFSKAVRRLADFPSAVLCGYDESGAPTMRRTRTKPVTDGFVLDGGDALKPGRASLLWHRHDENLADLRAFVVTGDLTRATDGCRLTPTHYVSTADRMGPLAMARMISGLRRSAARYLNRRGLSRPSIPWRDYAALERRSHPTPSRPA
ncbi:pyridoxamine 5'-phosphate oxidase family protein [Paractinoplanes rishiriensis]|uniref:Pyridoxamine 5'-phosphate oxidase N-terminal domain-containing protein n=1 Tax=Paractinoplanes rishiriensis TaxID=1050105 RepID=A0A919K2M4_9ACTN|nr:pyridoxamine 5'-phosphate oxidase family protein [Actinoplanes rishiriensis]GIE95501.1 hypothetical protein Ari01nite_29660 [Actinoplanes rishiriensis]